MECPNCRAVSPENAAECPQCGLIFAKWRPPAERPAPLTAPAAASPTAATAPLLGLLAAAVAAGSWFGFQSYRAATPAPAAANPDPDALATPAANLPAWLPPACDRALASLTPEETKAHRRFSPDCKNDPVGTLLYLNQHLSRPHNKVPAAEVTKLEVIPQFEGLSFGEDPKAAVRVLVVLRNVAGDPVSADGKLDVQVDQALAGTWERQATELSAVKFELTDDALQPALRADAGRLSFSLATVRGKKLFARVRFNDSVTDEGILDFNEVLPAR